MALTIVYVNYQGPAQVAYVKNQGPVQVARGWNKL